MKLVILRHGKTAGNIEGRYVGVTDEPLLPGEAERLGDLAVPEVDMVFSSPLRRCLETAAALYPGQPPVVIEGLRECDFGDFEYKNYQELNGNPIYQAWIDSEGKNGFPGGESMEEFVARSLDAYRKLLALAQAKGLSSAAIVAHGGTVMALMSSLARPRAPYYSWQPKNGEGYLLDSETGEFSKLGENTCFS